MLKRIVYKTHLARLHIHLYMHFGSLPRFIKNAGNVTGLEIIVVVIFITYENEKGPAYFIKRDLFVISF
ncbi:hypothetical protein LX64_00137 [Chitinophaga skermanii]|uniref:Uncharacterized protein n=1 Tax=Chitinophaga skermanii TaxID=331697 RepID=A0A327R430_9BACT|nr:hypothetical protein LX64_00137 [Chitinophaga skermanii]